jgi:hypothetical protein
MVEHRREYHAISRGVCAVSRFVDFLCSRHRMLDNRTGIVIISPASVDEKHGVAYGTRRFVYMYGTQSTYLVRGEDEEGGRSVTCCGDGKVQLTPG